MKFLSGIVINIWVTKGLEVAWLMCERQNSASLDWNVIFLLWSIRYTNKNQIRTKVQIFIYFSIHSPALLYIYIYLPISLSIYLSICIIYIYIVLPTKTWRLAWIWLDVIDFDEKRKKTSLGIFQEALHLW